MSDATAPELLELLRGIRSSVERVHTRLDLQGGFEARVEELGATLARIEAKLDLQDRRYDRLEARISDLEARVTELEAEEP